MRYTTSKNKIPVILITGNLGSGKTTLMQNLLKQEQRKIALIVNDMGSVNIDAALLNKNRDRIASVEMVELQNGCICCTLRDEFIAEIERISQLPDIEDPLPFKMNAPVVVIKDDDYAVWYSDIMNEAVKHHEKENIDIPLLRITELYEFAPPEIEIASF